MKTSTHLLITSCAINVRIRNVSDKSCRESQNTNCISNNLFFYFRKNVTFMR